MGVKHAREYDQILAELTSAVGLIPDSYVFFEMETEDWERLNDEDRHEVLEALAEDLFYGLGTEPQITVGSGIVQHDSNQHRIHVLIGESEISSVLLV
ncbi:hypothetical protein J2Z69_003883 [Paenibacillus shirakamiensis]|uniref:Uncharacterized protein n=1 Tax=Paenibacillus shirakamiensis TaxID=1265935 RepID=A0ABS4JM29_9BACL|nr:hypothetical protein [Paenibacillus shirakamiensis]MBP2002772.1 hypothetical protein [Paenibacillus shirakamiensis]